MKRNLLILVLGCILGLYQPLNAQDAENVVNGHEYVDLALPSGLKWATCNVGASKPETCGSYFAWGEIKPKDEYTEANSLTYGKEIDDISGNAQYDVAAANWGEGWRMPTKDEMQELIDNCDWEWTKQNNVKGYKVTGVNGNSIFIPETGFWSESTYQSGSCGNSYYWSSSPYNNNSSNCRLIFSSSSLHVDYYYRYCGYSIRPVIEVVEKPTVSASVEHYTDLTAIIKTFVSSSAEITERGFYCGTNTEPSEADNKVVLENEVGYKVSALFGLIPNTTYYVKAYATNSEGTSYSEVVSFATLETPVEYEYVDLGLPSGLKWATHNIGATTPEEYGNYYAWGEVFTKDEYTEKNSLTYGKSMSNISGTEYDAATFNWSGDWRMPTRAEMLELIDNCTWTWTAQNGVNGYKVASKVNSNSIFLPAAGYRNGTSLSGAGSSGNCWSSTPYSNNNYAVYLLFNSRSFDMGSNIRSDGRTVRPVREAVEKPTVTASVENYTDLISIIKTYASSSVEITERGFYWGTNAEPSEVDNKVVLENEVGYKASALFGLIPNTTYYVKAYATNSEGTSYSEVVSFTTLDEIVHEYVDLGLPSGLKWATCNVGANSPEEYGNYYAWGDVVTKTEYNLSNCPTYRVFTSQLQAQGYIDGEGNLTAQYDAATANWGGDWRMPTKAELNELLNNCTWTWTTQNGVSGYNVEGPNGNSIFLPAAGYRDCSSLIYAGSDGYYWSSTPNEHDYNNAYYLNFDSDGRNVGNSRRDIGLSVRPVLE